MPETATQQRVLTAVIGVGRMGRHHARTLSQMKMAKLVAVMDHDEDRAEQASEDYGGRPYTDVDALLAAHPDLQAVTIAVPTRFHFDAARPFLERGIACMIEKPLAGTSGEAKQIAQLAAAHGAVLQVGHTERFNPAVRAVMGLGMTPRFLEVIRISPMTFRSLDVGVVMDMMIHDLDIVLALAGSRIQSVQANGVCLMGEHEDIANARIVFDNGCVANLTGSRLALKVERRLRLFSDAAYISLDYQKRHGSIIQKNADNTQALTQVRAALAEGQDLSSIDYSDIVQVEELSMDSPDGIDDPLTAEQTAFLTAAVKGLTPLVDAAAGVAAVQAAEQVLAAIQSHKYEGIDQPRIH